MERLGTEQNGRTPAVLDKTTALENANDIDAFLKSEMERIGTERIKLAERQIELEKLIRSLGVMTETLSVLEPKTQDLPSALQNLSEL